MEVEPALPLRGIVERLANRAEVGKAARLFVDRWRCARWRKLGCHRGVAIEHAIPFPQMICISARANVQPLSPWPATVAQKGREGTVQAPPRAGSARPEPTAGARPAICRQICDDPREAASISRA